MNGTEANLVDLGRRHNARIAHAAELVHGGRIVLRVLVVLSLDEPSGRG